MAKALMAMLIGFLVGFQGVAPAVSSADSLDMGKLYCCRFDCPSRHCEDRARGCYYIDKIRCLRWVAFGNARVVQSCDECSFPRRDFAP